MALVNVTNISLLNNPSSFDADFQFEISFYLMAPIKNDLEWRLVYVGSADSSKHDQLLDTVNVGPIEVGQSKFVFEAPAPDMSKIPSKDVLGVTIVMLIASYNGSDFFKVGYYVSNELAPGQELKMPQGQNIIRHVLTSNPKSSKFDIKWD